MTGSMLIVAWPSGTDVVSSLRETRCVINFEYDHSIH